MRESLILKKKQKLRNNEYYNIQDKFDDLYNEATKGREFNKLMDIISSKENILLAYRNIKNNKGSTTLGTDKMDISFYKKWDEERFVKYFQGKFNNYEPKSVRRVEIPKPNGKTRPLGIPCMNDRIIQQCIKQVLEPICESKFHRHSYGFRLNRSTHHAIARSMQLINISKLHYVIDIDIKGFFDNVNHSKLKKQLWTLGIRDKNLISIIGKILKSEIEGIGVPTKGTPQGGIISPLLSNIVLNELDWWISNQWETFNTRHEYNNISNKYREIKKSNLKQVFMVRYADDFKIFCNDYQTARKMFQATKSWLEERLGLEISPEKSKITNIRKKKTEFLGFLLYVKPKKNKYICQSQMSNKAIKTTILKLKKQVKKIQYSGKTQEINKLNAMILGSHNYYKIATQVNINFSLINFLVNQTIYNRLKNRVSVIPYKTKTYEKLYGNYNGKIISINETTIFPIYGVKNSPPLNFNNNICNYTHNGRELIHNNLSNSNLLIKYLLDTESISESVEYKDNKISLIAGQKGICYVTEEQLIIGNMECHHKTPKSLGGTDEYKNLVWIRSEVHKLIHATNTETINKYLNILNLNDKGMKKVNSLRKRVGNLII